MSTTRAAPPQPSEQTAATLAAAAARGRPWYRDYWPWLLMLPPAASVAGGLTMIYLATSVPATLVVEDYARIEEITSARFARDDRAAALGLEAALEFALASGADARASTADRTDRGDSADHAVGAGRTATVTITARLSTTDDAFIAPGAVMLKLRHATSRAADRELVLARVGSDYFTQGALAPGRYAVELVALDESWRLGGSLTRVPGTLRITAQAGAANAAGTAR